MDLRLTSGPIPTAILAVGISAFGYLLLVRDRRWLFRRASIAIGAGGVCSGVVVLFVDKVWKPFRDPLPDVAITWGGLTITAIVLALLRPTSKRRKALALAVSLAVAVSGAAQINRHYGAYPTVRAVLQLKLKNQVPYDRSNQPPLSLIKPVAGKSFDSVWSPPGNMSLTGTVSTVDIPGAVSGFNARPAWIYEPPAYTSFPRAELPVLVLMAGQPGAPRDWFDGGQLSTMMDAFAQAHNGLAPVVVVADPLGGQLANPACSNSRRGNAFTYMSQDVPNWIRGNLQIDPNPRHWAVGGLSSGGTCSLQLAVNAPEVYPTFVTVSGEDEPSTGSHAETVRDIFAGDKAAFTRVNPIDVLQARRFPGTSAFIVAGRDDSTYDPQARRVAAASRAAGIDVTYVELPGSHSWAVWGPGLGKSLPWLATKTGLTQ